MRATVDTILVCPICRRAVSRTRRLFTERSLQQHIETAHPDERCPLCGVPNKGVCDGCRAGEGAWS